MARGCGWQHLAAYVNLATFYLIGLPISCLLGFKTNLQYKVNYLLHSITMFVLMIRRIILILRSSQKSKPFSFICLIIMFPLNLLYDIGFMDWSDLWAGVSSWDAFTSHKTCQMD